MFFKENLMKSFHKTSKKYKLDWVPNIKIKRTHPHKYTVAQNTKKVYKPIHRHKIMPTYMNINIHAGICVILFNEMK